MSSKLKSASSLAMNHLIKEGKLSFLEAAKKIAEKRKRHVAEVERARRAFAEGTPKMRLLVEKRTLGVLNEQLESLRAHKTITADLLLEIGAVEQKIHDVKEMMEADRRKSGSPKTKKPGA